MNSIPVVQSTMQSNDECSVKAELWISWRCEDEEMEKQFQRREKEWCPRWKHGSSVENAIYIAQVGRGTALRGRRTNYSIIVWPPAAHMTVIFSLLCAATAACLYTLCQCRRLDRIDELHSTVYNSALSLW